MRDTEQLFKSLVEGAKNASPERKQQGEEIAAKFVYRRLSYKQRKETQCLI